MTYPQQYPPQQPVPGFPPAPQPQQQPSNAYPPQGGYQPGWQQQGYPQGYPQAVQQPPQPAPPAQSFSLDQFFDQPNTASGPSLTKNGQVGYAWVGVVARDVTDGDVQQQTKHPSQGGGPAYNRDGSPQLTMLVPLEQVAREQDGQLYASPEHPEAKATLYVQGGLRQEYARARTEAGCPPGPPRKGEVVFLKLRGKLPTNGGSGIPKNDWECRVSLPAGQAPAAQPAPEQTLAAPDNSQIGPPMPVPAGGWAQHDAQALQQSLQQGVQQPAPAQQLQPLGQPTLPGMDAPDPEGSLQFAAPQAPALSPPAGLSDTEQSILQRLAGQQ